MELLKAKIHLRKWVEVATADADEICNYCEERGWLRPTYELVIEHVAANKIFTVQRRKKQTTCFLLKNMPSSEEEEEDQGDIMDDE